MNRVIRGITAAYGAKFKIEYNNLGGSLENNETVLSGIKREAALLLGTGKVVDLSRASMGGEDFAAYLEDVPGAFIYLGAGNPAKGIKFPWHHARFDIDEEALPVGAAVLAQSIWSYQ
jgi:amidohydrolase